LSKETPFQPSSNTVNNAFVSFAAEIADLIAEPQISLT
jgi:hypothetical protein